MFPLEHVVLPGAPLALSVFEPRYVALVKRLAATDEPEFGTVGIRQGREVGGGETRSEVGVVVRVVDTIEHHDGRWSIFATGTRRVAVDDWHPDDPYPIATVHDWPDPVVADLSGSVADLRASLEGLIDRLGHREPRLPDSGSDSGVLDSVVWELIRLAGFGPHDAMKLLALPDSSQRAQSARQLIDERCELLDALGHGER